MKKQAIVNAGIAGVPLFVRDVAVTSRDKRMVTLRHKWPENVDARAWDAVKRVVWRHAQVIADRTRRPVEVYSAEGDLLDSIEPQKEGA